VGAAAAHPPPADAECEPVALGQVEVLARVGDGGRRVVASSALADIAQPAPCGSGQGAVYDGAGDAGQVALLHGVVGTVLESRIGEDVRGRVVQQILDALLVVNLAVPVLVITSGCKRWFRHGDHVSLR